MGPMDAKIKRAKIVWVDDDETNLSIGKEALSERYDVLVARGGEELFEILESVMPDIILLDADTPRVNGYDVIQKLKSDDRTAYIPVLFVTAAGDIDSEFECFSLGATDCIAKPFSLPKLRRRVETCLACAAAARDREELQLQSDIIKLLADMAEFRNVVLGGHIDRTEQYLDILISELLRQGVYSDEIAAWDTETILRASKLHDVGKSALRDAILLKPGKLTPEEFQEMEKHTTYGVMILEKIEKESKPGSFIHHAKTFAGTHHEKWDGSGYPQGLAGSAIPLEGRLMAIADVYDALVSERAYKAVFPHDEAVLIIEEGRGNHFDPVLVDTFFSVADRMEKASRR